MASRLQDVKVAYRCTRPDCDGETIVTRAYLGDGRDPDVWIDGVDGESLACPCCETGETEFDRLTGDLADHER